MRLRGVVAVFMLAGFAIGCASSSKNASCDPATGSNCEVDAGLPGEASIDGGPKRGFGEECTDRDQCESNLCVHVGTSGVCTMTCGECPPDWGCLGVTGVDIDGQVTFVCVPESNQLCTPCTQHTECSYVGMDLCVEYGDGDKYCSRSCDTVTCPTGYECETVNVGGINYEQCLPASGACDCSAANPGQMEPCNIPTPFGVCIGSRTCAGATGWGTCEPPSQVDDPDAGYEDSNCDGIDGDIERAIFVAGGGVNGASCGLVYTNPCQTIPFAISRAQAAGRPHIYVQSGTYAGSLTMVSGISIFGGYDFNWQRAPHSDPGHGVTIVGGVIGVRFNAITQPTWLDNVIVQSANATAIGGSSIGVLVTGSTGIELRGVLVDPGAGGPGNPGNDGFVGGGGGTGGTGTPGCENSGSIGCSDCPLPARGTQGTSPCGRLGGIGGAPGNGGNGGATGGVGSIGTPGGAGATCSGSRNCDGTIGEPGAYGGLGTNGSGGLAIGTFSGSSYFASAGTMGTTGSHGNGGGGGGGGGGGTNNCDSYGSSGGGGGGGGCGGGGGTGGTGGGGSFGVVALDSQLVLDSATVMGRAGGAGGRGGTGGPPGSGGTGGFGGAYGGDGEQDDGGDGARGGRGGDGGRGGHGGGGGGGPSIAVVCLGTSTSTTSAIASTLLGGTGGLGGSSGAPGQNGLSAMTYGCPF